MNGTQMKKILAQKLHDEGCYFTSKDISVTKKGQAFWIVIKDYEHIQFKITTEEDDYFGKIVWIHRYWKDNKTEMLETDGIVGMYDSKKDFPYQQALINLGYYIGSRF